MLDGASGGNILVAQAYIADVTRPEEVRWLAEECRRRLGALDLVVNNAGAITHRLLVDLPCEDDTAGLHAVAPRDPLTQRPVPRAGAVREEGRALAQRDGVDAVGELLGCDEARPRSAAGERDRRFRHPGGA